MFERYRVAVSPSVSHLPAHSDSNTLVSHIFFDCFWSVLHHLFIYRLYFLVWLFKSDEESTLFWLRRFRRYRSFYKMCFLFHKFLSININNQNTNSMSCHIVWPGDQYRWYHYYTSVIHHMSFLLHVRLQHLRVWKWPDLT